MAFSGGVRLRSSVSFSVLQKRRMYASLRRKISSSSSPSGLMASSILSPPAAFVAA